MSGDVGSNRRALVHPVRTAVIVALVAALVLLGLLLERSGSSPVKSLNISSGQAAPASGAAGHGANATPPAALHTVLNGATISGGGASQITNTTSNGEDTCTEFTGGTAGTVSTVSYDTKSDGTLSKVTTPGSFWYFVSISVSSPGSQSFTITQSTNYAPTSGTPYFSLGGGSTGYDGSCNPLGTTVTGGGASTTVSFTAPAAGTYIVGVKFMTHSVVGSSQANTTPGFSYNYTFATTGASGSTQGLMLTHV
jgi:hypothetical protein